MTLALIIAAIIIGDSVIFIGIIAVFMRIMWTPIAAAHPQQTPADDAVLKKFQSFKIDMLNLGFCIHTSVDEHYLHLTPVKILQKLSGKPASIAWINITDVKPTRFGKTMSARIGKHKITGPAWCLQLAVEDENAAHEPQNASNG